jgi:hypothetical protein
MRQSCATPSLSSTAAAFFIVSQSDWLPMMMATGAPDVWLSLIPFPLFEKPAAQRSDR